jgi:hypothetical protein
MRFALNVCANLIGIPLEVLILAAFLRGSYRRYPALFVYMSAVFVVSLLETPLYIMGHFDLHSAWHSQWVKCYYIDERVLMGLVFVAVLSLIYQATEQVRSRRVMRASVVCGAILVAAVTFWIHYNPTVPTGQWMAPWTSDLYFCAAILDLGLWIMLIGSSAKDPRLLMFSGALGILFAGSAIAESIANLAVPRRSTALTFVGGLVNIMSNLTFLYVWWQALRTREAPVRTA